MRPFDIDPSWDAWRNAGITPAAPGTLHRGTLDADGLPADPTVVVDAVHPNRNGDLLLGPGLATANPVIV